MTPNQGHGALRGCPLCEAGCGLALTLDAEARVTSVRGDPEDAFSHGYLCPKGASFGHIDADPDRLTRPLVRHGDRLHEADWDEAFAVVDQRLGAVFAEHGRDAVAVYTGNPTGNSVAFTQLGARLARVLGTRQAYSPASMDQAPQELVAALMLGDAASIPVPDLDRTDLMVVIGANPLVTNGSVGSGPDYRGRLRALRRRGGRLVVLDPVRTATAAAADQHIPVRPGGDVFLLLALVHVLFRDGLVRLRRAEGRVAGLEAVRELAHRYPPERVAAAAGVPAQVIARLAHEIATAERAAVYGRLGTTLNRFGALTVWAVQLVNVLAGHLDEPGGMMSPAPATGSATTRRRTGPARPVRLGRWATRVRGLPEVLGELPVAALAEEILTPGPGRVRGLVVYAGNPARSFPNSTLIQRALAELDVMVCVDPYLNETTRHADVILPPAPPLTADHFDAAILKFSLRNYARFSPAARALPAGMASEWDILLRLCGIYEGCGPNADPAAIDDEIAGRLATNIAGELGLDAEQLLARTTARHGRGPRRLVDLRLRSGPYGDLFGARPGGLSLQGLLDRPHGIDLGPLRSRLDEVIRTPSDRIELAPAVLRADLTRLDHELDTGPVDTLLLVGRRDMRSKNSWLHNIPSLAKGRSRATLFLHPIDAARCGVAGAGRAIVRSPAGRLEVEVTITEDVTPGVCSLPHGWGHDDPHARLRVAARQPGVNSNTLTDDTVLDALSNTVQLNAVPVEVLPLDAVAQPIRSAPQSIARF